MSQPLAKQAYGKIIEMILAGMLKPGDVLQEAKLGDELAMSRTPVREAIKRIEAEGLAVQEGRFLKVRTLTIAEVEEIFFLRGVIESHCVRNATSIASGTLDDLERRVMALIAQGPGEDDEERVVDDDFHLSFARAAGNQMMVRTIRDLRRRTCMFDHSLVPARFLKGCNEHLEIIKAIREKDGARAGQLMKAHVGNARDAILERLKAEQARATR
ncbi:GntR family transcriptional regulator [Rhizobium sp. S152]|uniref:GntR family transcriptional regulator n=1 Tax=Rhizobium sp. S152 TaxID=3055038 RepID=UPI0025A9F466|nr:GntR family transcriptional regulator [Rhizobium sp. S152]MDM9625494.1 GntR family transcriptional regulator [Rhizobium sp. S152]